MGQELPTLNKTQLQSDLRQAKARITIRRGQKLNAINKKRKEIKAHLESANEMMALVHVIKYRVKGVDRAADKRRENDSLL